MLAYIYIPAPWILYGYYFNGLYPLVNQHSHGKCPIEIDGLPSYKMVDLFMARWYNFYTFMQWFTTTTLVNCANPRFKELLYVYDHLKLTTRFPQTLSWVSSICKIGKLTTLGIEFSYKSLEWSELVGPNGPFD